MDRYLSDRIQQVSEQAKEKEEQFAILSGKYGLLEPEEQIPYYDKLLKKQHLPEMIPEVEKQLQQRESKKLFTTRGKLKTRDYLTISSLNRHVRIRE